MKNITTADEGFFDSIDYKSIIDNIRGIYTSDGSMNTLLDYERCLDEADLYAFKNWELGELVAGPEVKRYTVSCVFMYPHKLMPDPRGAKRLLAVGCTIQFKKTTIKIPVQIEIPDDFKPGTHYPKMVKRDVWLVRIVIPKELMNDIREGSIDLADQTIDLGDLDDAYAQDLDKENQDGEQQSQDQMGGMGMPPGLGQGPGGMGL